MKKFNQADYVKEHAKENYKEFKTKIKKKKFEQIDNYIKEKNKHERYTRADFLRDAMQALKIKGNPLQGEEKMKIEEVKKFLKGKEVKVQESFQETFELGNCGKQASEEEKNIELENGYLFVIVDGDYRYAYISVSDNEDEEVYGGYFTYETLEKLYKKIDEKNNDYIDELVSNLEKKSVTSQRGIERIYYEVDEETYNNLNDANLLGSNINAGKINLSSVVGKTFYVTKK